MGVAFLVAMSLAGLPLPPVTPVPAWVEQVELQRSNASESGSTRILLHDVQVRVGKTVERNVRRAWKVLSQAGVADGSRTELEWDPAWQQLELHGVWVWRDGVRRVAWHPEDARVIQREEDLAQGLYDGRHTLVIEVRDVRVGDVVELSSTVKGENPAFRGHVSLREAQVSGALVERRRFRLEWERPRPLTFRAFGGAVEPSVVKAGARTTYRWELSDVKPVEFESSVPNDLEVWPFVDFSDWDGWGEVARWASTLFAQQGQGVRFEAEVKRFRALPAADRAAAIVRFVQDDVRYVGVEIGAHSHQPHAPAWVLERGFGDCKDKALLLVALLRATGHEAWPALVHSERGATLGGELPSATAFNHAIVQLARPDGPRFIDATWTQRRGAVDQMAQPRYRNALIVRPETTGLEPIPFELPEAATWEVEQSWVVPRGAKSTLTVTTTARREEAWVLRRQVASSTKDELEQHMLRARQEGTESKLVPLGVRWTDDERLDAMTLVEEYQVEAFYVQGKHLLESMAVDGDLRRLGEQPRKYPLALSYPMRVKETVRWFAPDDVLRDNYELTNKVITHPAFELEVRQQVEGQRGLRLEWELTVKKDRVELSELDAYRTATEEAHRLFGYELYQDARRAPAPERKRDEPVAWGLVMGVVVAGGFILGARGTWLRARAWWDRRRGKRFRAKQLGRPGELASQPASVASVEDGARLFDTARCPVGHAWGAVAPRDTVRLGDDRITVLSRACTSCEAREDRYVTIRSP